MHNGGLHIDGTMPRGRDLGVAGDAERGGISADPNDDGHGQKSRRCGVGVEAISAGEWLRDAACLAS